MQVFFDEHIFHKQTKGGISRYICDLAISLAQTKKIKVILFAGWCKNAFLRELPQHSHLHLIYKKRNDDLKINSFVKSLSSFWRRIEFRRAIAQDPETIYHPTYFEIDNFINKKSRATVVTFYDMIAERFRKDRQKRHRLLKQSAAQKADRIIAISESTRKDLEHFYPFTPIKTHVVYLGSDLKGTPHQHQSDNSLTRLTREKYFLMIGERRGYKNGLAALKAFAILSKTTPNIHLILCGGNTKIAADERSLIERNMITDRVHHLTADDTALVTLIRNAIAFIYPSHYEGFGLPVLEAMQHGCPVITTRLSSLPEVAGEAAIYVDPDSPDSIAYAMEYLIDQPKEREAYIQRGHRQARQFSTDKMAEEMLTIYRDSVEKTNF